MLALASPTWYVTIAEPAAGPAAAPVPPVAPVAARTTMVLPSPETPADASTMFGGNVANGTGIGAPPRGAKPRIAGTADTGSTSWRSVVVTRSARLPVPNAAANTGDPESDSWRVPLSRSSTVNPPFVVGGVWPVVAATLL